MKNTLVGSGPCMERIREKINHAAESGSNIIIYGEKGVGKELTARSIYLKSSRQSQPFVRIDCESLPEKVLGDKLFGYENGSLTGAQSSQFDKPGIWEGCVLFFDKIDVTPLSIQSEIFHVLRNDKISRSELNRSKLSGFLILSAATQALEPEVRAGKFNEKLYHLINGTQIYIPPLRNRVEEIPALIDYYLKKYAFSIKNDLQLHPDINVMQQLMRYQWPENISQLKDVVQRFLTLGDWEVIVEKLLSNTSKTAHGFNSVS